MVCKKSSSNRLDWRKLKFNKFRPKKKSLGKKNNRLWKTMQKDNKFRDKFQALTNSKDNYKNLFRKLLD